MPNHLGFELMDVLAEAENYKISQGERRILWPNSTFRS